MTSEEFRKLALALPEGIEEPHFEKSSFRVRKKIYATLDIAENTAVLKLSPEQQSEFCDLDGLIVYPVKGKWGEKGWTKISLDKVHTGLLTDALRAAYKNVAPKTLSGNL